MAACRQMRTTTECAYLSGGGPDGLGALRFAALYGSWEATRARAMFALHLPMDTRCAAKTLSFLSVRPISCFPTHLTHSALWALPHSVSLQRPYTQMPWPLPSHLPLSDLTLCINGSSWRNSA